MFSLSGMLAALRRLWGLSTYTIVVGTSRIDADDAAAQAQLRLNAAAQSGGNAVGIAADAICCPDVAEGDGGHGGAGGTHHEWNVYILVKT